MARRASLINAVTKGVLDPRLHERQDLVHYYTALDTGRNVQVRPQGGFRRRAGGYMRQRRLRRRLEPVQVTTTMITAHNGGTASALVDQDISTAYETSAVGADVFVVAEVDLGVAMPIAFVDLEGFRGASLRFDDVLAVEYWDGAGWRPAPGADDATLSPRRNLRTSSRTRRFGGKPGTVMTSRSFRVVLYGAVGAGVITLDGLRMWSETGRLSPARFVPFAKSVDDVYQLVFTDRNIDVFERGLYLASIPVALGAAEIDSCNNTQSQDTAFLYHEDLKTPRITRQGARDEWDTSPAPWTNVPALETSTSFTGEQDEIQSIAFPALTAGQQIVLFLADQVTAPIVFTAAGDLPAQLTAALVAIPGVASDGILATLTGLSPVAVRIQFTGGSAGRRWPKLDARVLGGSLDPVTTTVQRGIKVDGLIMSDETGWPRAGALIQSRHLVAGFRAAPQTLMASVIGDLFNFDMTIDPVIPSNAIQYTLESKQVETIYEIFLGRHLQIFTESGEWWVENRTLDATQPLNVILATRHGLEASVPLVFAENATLFLQQDGLTLRDMVYVDVEQNYAAEPLSLLGPHLLTGVVSLAIKKSTDVNEGNLIYLTNGDGSVATLTLLRSQDVIAMTEYVTSGAMVDIEVDAAGEVWQIVQRAGELVLEQVDENCLFDSSVAFSSETPIDVVTVGPHLEGQQVWAMADRDLSGPYTVTNGEITLSKSALAGYVGLPYLAYVRTLPLREKLQQEQPFRPPGRVYEVELSLINTGAVSIGANGEAEFDVPLRNFSGGPEPVDRLGTEPTLDQFSRPLLDRLYTGTVTLEDIEGISKHCRVVVTQEIPAPLEVRSMRYEVSY